MSRSLSTACRWRRRAVALAAGYAILVALLWLFPAKNARADETEVRSVNDAASAAHGPSGDDACFACHADLAEHYHATAHFRTSAPASRESVHGHFDRGRNQLRTGNPNLYFQMEEKDGRFFETAVVRTSPTEAMTRAEAIDIVIGSGRKGQTYLFWDENRLFQLPVSFWTGLDQWANSPGYADGFANFERPIDRRCLECHATSAAWVPPAINQYNPARMSWGLRCEKCHGPGEAHLAAMRAAAATRQVHAETHIVNPAKLPRARQMDICATCHAGIGNSITAPGSFRPGDDLSNHLALPATEPGAPLDVHANQVELLEQSRCFRASSSMTCSTCHDVHREQRDLGALSARCLSCHRVEDCGEFHARGATLRSRCVVCHMPLQKTAQIVSIANGQTLQPMVRNHRIAIYPPTQ